MSEKNNEGLIQHLICPVCLTHPEHQVYQCVNGHPICSSCINRLANCPQCKVVYGRPRSRCRLMESILDNVKLPCANKPAGCSQEFIQKELDVHKKFCTFRPVNVCELLGFKCKYQAATVEPFVNHLESCHNAQKWNAIVWKNFVGAPFSGLYLLECTGDLRNPQNTWILLLVKQSAECSGQNFQKIFSCVPILLQDGVCTDEHEVYVNVYYQREQKGHLLSTWIGFPTNYKDPELDIVCPPIQLTTNYVKKQAMKFSQLNQFDLSLNFSTTVKPIQTG